MTGLTPHPQLRPSGQRVDDESAAAWIATINLAMMRAELRRRRRLWIALTAIGGFLGLLAAATVGSAATATTTVLLARESGVPASDAMQTDLGLLYTRALAEQVIAYEDLRMDPEELLSTVTTRTGGGELLTLVVATEGPDEAVKRADALARIFLDFRAGVLTTQSRQLVTSYEKQLTELDGSVADLTNQIAGLQGSAVPSDVARVNELIAERAGLRSQESQLRQEIQAEKVRVATLVGASRVVDQAAVEPTGKSRRAILGAFSGAIGGLGLGVAIVLGQAMLTDRPRRRADVAACIGAPVAVGVDRVVGRGRRPSRARAAAADVIRRRAITGVPPARGLAVLGVASEREASAVAAELAQRLAQDGFSVDVIDLTRRGLLQRRVHHLDRSETAARGKSDHRSVHVLRPEWVPTPAQPPTSLRDVLDTAVVGGPGRRRSSAAIALVVGEVDPAIGAEHFASLADVAVLVLAAGSASAERLRTTAQLIRVAGMNLAFAIVTNSDQTDESLGETGELAPPASMRWTSEGVPTVETRVTDRESR